MSDETKAPTKEEVERWYAEAKLPHGDGNCDCRPCRHLDRLKAAALLGAQVPGLVLERDDWRRKALDRDLQVVGLTSEVSTLQARVAELERERDAARAAVHEWKKIKDRLVSERDALRAQAEKVSAALRRLLGSYTHLPGSGAFAQHLAPCGCVVCEALDALSAPPTETKKETDDEAHQRLDVLGVPRFGRCGATNKREPLPLEERRELAPPAEPKVEPERTEGRWAKSGAGTVLHYFTGQQAACGRRAPGGDWGPGILYKHVCERCAQNAPTRPDAPPAETPAHERKG